jgi:hypothetical protein
MGSAAERLPPGVQGAVVDTDLGLRRPHIRRARRSRRMGASGAFKCSFKDSLTAFDVYEHPCIIARHVDAQRFCGTSCVSQRGTQTSHLPGQSLRPEFAKRPLTNRSAGAHASAGSSAGRVHSVLIAGLRICGFRFSHWAIAKRIFEVTDSTKNDFPELSQAYNQTRKPCRQR